MKEPRRLEEVDHICDRLQRLQGRDPERFEQCLELVRGVMHLQGVARSKHVDVQAQQWEFLKLQYAALRGEIQRAKSRLFKLAVVGITVVPALHVLAGQHKWDALIIAMPILIILLALLYLSESRGMMRCGKYLREMIEPNIAPLSDTWLPWEKWLESEGSAREPDKYLYYCFQIIFCVYYTGALYFSAQLAHTHYGPVALMPLLACYLPVGIFFVIFMQKSMESCTTTSRAEENPHLNGSARCFSSSPL